jgi:hypothetical protein
MSIHNPIIFLILIISVLAGSGGLAFYTTLPKKDKTRIIFIVIFVTSIGCIFLFYYLIFKLFTSQ